MSDEDDVDVKVGFGILLGFIGEKNGCGRSVKMCAMLTMGKGE